MLFKYTALTTENEETQGQIDAINKDVAIDSLQQRGLTIVSIEEAGKRPFWQMNIGIFSSVSNKDVVILSRQLATLFVAEVSALRIFRMLGAEMENPVLRRKLTEVADSVQGGSPISKAMAEHPDVFSDFYVNMVRAGEESGKLNETFEYLADYLDRSYGLTVKIRNALIYPAFVLSMFSVVIILLFTMVFPRLTAILEETGQEIPFYTKIVIGISQFFVDYGIFLLIALIVGGFATWRFAKTEQGRIMVGQLQIETPLIGNLFRKFYLARMADVLYTMLSSGIPVVRALEITGAVVNNAVYKSILDQAAADVRAGSSISEALSPYPEVPGIFIQITKIGEETGELGNILKTLADFYRREVDAAVDALIGLIEPIMIVVLGLGVGIVLVSVLLPIYNITTGI